MLRSTRTLRVLLTRPEEDWNRATAPRQSASHGVHRQRERVAERLAREARSARASGERNFR